MGIYEYEPANVVRAAKKMVYTYLQKKQNRCICKRSYIYAKDETYPQNSCSVTVGIYEYAPGTNDVVRAVEETASRNRAIYSTHTHAHARAHTHIHIHMCTHSHILCKHTHTHTTGHFGPQRRHGADREDRAVFPRGLL